MTGIYLIKSPTNKVYVGQSINIEKRFLKYKTGDCANQIVLFKSLIKYGWINHSFEILEECSIDDLNTKERFYQEKYNVLSENGLNCVLVDANGKSRVYSTELIEKMSVSARKRIVSKIRKDYQSKIMKGRKFTDEHKLKIGKANKGKVHYWNKGIPTSDYQKKRASETNKKKINQYTKEMIFIKSWDSLISAGKELGIHTKNISDCLVGKRKTTHKFIWKYCELEDI